MGTKHSNNLESNYVEWEALAIPAIKNKNTKNASVLEDLEITQYGYIKESLAALMHAQRISYFDKSLKLPLELKELLDDFERIYFDYYRG